MRISSAKGLEAEQSEVNLLGGRGWLRLKRPTALLRYGGLSKTELLEFMDLNTLFLGGGWSIGQWARDLQEIRSPIFGPWTSFKQLIPTTGLAKRAALASRLAPRSGDSLEVLVCNIAEQLSPAQKESLALAVQVRTALVSPPGCGSHKYTKMAPWEIGP